MVKVARDLGSIPSAEQVLVFVQRRAMKQAVQRVIDSLEIQEFRVEDNDGRWYSMRIRPYRTIDNKIDGVVIVLLDMETRRAHQA